MEAEEVAVAVAAHHHSELQLPQSQRVHLFAPRARGNNQNYFNAQTRGASERRRGSFRGSNASRGGGRGTRKDLTCTNTFSLRPRQPKHKRQHNRVCLVLRPHPPSPTASRLYDPHHSMIPWRSRQAAHWPGPLLRGTCPDMCQSLNVSESVVQKDVWGPELDDQGAPAEHAHGKRSSDALQLALTSNCPQTCALPVPSKLSTTSSTKWSPTPNHWVVYTTLSRTELAPSATTL